MKTPKLYYPYTDILYVLKLNGSIKWKCYLTFDLKIQFIASIKPKVEFFNIFENKRIIALEQNFNRP